MSVHIDGHVSNRKDWWTQGHVLCCWKRRTLNHVILIETWEDLKIMKVGGGYHNEQSLALKLPRLSEDLQIPILEGARGATPARRPTRFWQYATTFV